MCCYKIYQMTPEVFHRVKDHYDELEETFRDKCLELPFHLDGEEYTEYCQLILKPFKDALLVRMVDAADEEDFAKALAIQRFIRDRMPSI